jgi:hypothetical protein
MCHLVSPLRLHLRAFSQQDEMLLETPPRLSHRGYFTQHLPLRSTQVTVAKDLQEFFCHR